MLIATVVLFLGPLIQRTIACRLYPAHGLFLCSLWAKNDFNILKGLQKSKTKCNKHKQTYKEIFLKRRVCNRYCILPLKPEEFIKCLFIKKCFPINVFIFMKYILKYWAYVITTQINFQLIRAFSPVTLQQDFPHYAFLTPFLQRKPVFQEKLYIYSFVLSCNI